MALFGKPRVFRLVETASRAELLRRKRHVRGYALRAGFGAAAAAFGAGALRDALGSYTLAWFGGAALCALAAVLSVVLRRPAQPEREPAVEAEAASELTP